MLRRYLLPLSKNALNVRYLSTLNISGKDYVLDDLSNIRQSISSHVGRNIYLLPHHPIAILNSLVHSHFGPTYTVVPPKLPVVTPEQNFDSLSFPPDHPGRRTSDSYYINRQWMLRTHTSAHEVEVFAEGHKRWLFTADVYRRDEIDASHHPVFHQMEGARLWSNAELSSLAEENRQLETELSRQDILIEDLSTIGSSNPIQPCHDETFARMISANLKLSINGLLLKLFRTEGSGPLKVRWIDAYFPFTSPSYEVEVFYQGKWLEILGSGVVAQSTLDKAGIKSQAGWAFGLGLERIAMVLFQIPDIRLFWTTDERFLQQFQPGLVTSFKPYSKYPPITHDISFWLPASQEGENPFHENDFCDIVRDIAGDIVEDVKLVRLRSGVLKKLKEFTNNIKVDNFAHPQTGRTSQCYRIQYRSMGRTLRQEEANVITEGIKKQLVTMFNVESRG